VYRRIFIIKSPPSTHKMHCLLKDDSALFSRLLHGSLSRNTCCARNLSSASLLLL
jgi:hypothetical protein